MSRGLPAAGALGALDTDRGARYADVITAWLSAAARRALEEFMSLHGYEFQSEFAKKYAAEGRKEGLIQGIEALCDALSISVSSEQRDVLKTAEVERLEAILDALRKSKQWPELGEERRQ